MKNFRIPNLSLTHTESIIEWMLKPKSFSRELIIVIYERDAVAKRSVFFNELQHVQHVHMYAHFRMLFKATQRSGNQIAYIEGYIKKFWFHFIIKKGLCFYTT